MNNVIRFRAAFAAIILALLLLGCSSDSSTGSSAVDTESVPTAVTAATAVPTTAPLTVEPVASGEDSEGPADDHEHDDDDTDTAEATAGVNPDLFFDGALAEDVTVEECTLSGGAETMCYRITVAGEPVTYDTGPFCPETITDSAEAGGIWFDGNGVYDVDGEFIANLAELYNDDNWKMYDDDGNVLVVESAEEFDLAARPDVDPSLQNHCVEGRLEWLTDGLPVSTTVLLPVEPVLADEPSTSRGNLGVTLDGVTIANSAPVDAILSAYTIAAFDDCGGHYNPFDGYHLHGAVGCSELTEASDGETPMFAYAMDGFPIHSALEADAAAAADLDECNGHFTEADGYHYHANNAAENQVLECLVGQIAQTGETDDAQGGGGAPAGDGERPAGPPPGDEDTAGPPPAGDEAGGEAVPPTRDEGATAQEGNSAAGPPPAGDETGGGGPGGGGGPDFTAAAAALGVTVEQLEAALGGPPPDFEAAATTLGISVEELMAVLPAPPG